MTVVPAGVRLFLLPSIGVAAAIRNNASADTQRFRIVDFLASFGFLFAVFFVFPTTSALAGALVVFVFAAAFGLATLITFFAASRFASCA